MFRLVKERRILAEGKKMRLNTRLFEAIAMLIGTTNGAGVLGIPYVVAQSGLAVGLLHIIIIGTAAIMVNLLLGEIVLRTKGNHQLSGYAAKYLGEGGKKLMTLAMAAAIYGALLAYLIGVGDSISAILPQATPLLAGILFFAVAASIVYLGLKAVERSERLLATLTLAVISTIIIGAILSDQFTAANLPGTDLQHTFLPYGVVLFAFLGAVAIPEMKEELGRDRRKLKKAIIIGGLLPIAIYSLFTVAVVGISGAATGQIATVELGARMGSAGGGIANLFAILAMSTSFIALGLALKEMYMYDYKIGKNTAWMLTCMFPLIAFLVGIKNFIGVIGLAGAVAGGIEGILLVSMHHKAQKKKPERKPEYAFSRNRFLSVALFMMFLLGITYALLAAIRT